MADRGQFSGANEFGVARPLQDIHDYIGGGAVPRSPVEQYDRSGQQGNYLDLLARLLSNDEWTRMVGEWRKRAALPEGDPQRLAWPDLETDVSRAPGG